MNTPFVWNSMTPLERLNILRVFENRGPLKARSRHAMIYGTEAEIPKTLRDAVYMIDWEAHLGRKTS
jgi:hypothetical protein